MQVVLLVGLLISAVLGWKITDNSFSSINKLMKAQEFGGEGNLGSCSSTQVNTASRAVAACDGLTDYSALTSCMINYIENRTSEKWNVYSRAYHSNDSVAYWTVGDCQVYYHNYGKHNRTFNLWPAVNYSGKEIVGQQKIKGSSTESKVKILGECLSSRVSAVKAAVADCDFPAKNSDSAMCIKNKMQNSIGQSWNVYVSTKLSSISYWYYDDCSIIFEGYGSYNRTYKVWKADSA